MGCKLWRSKFRIEVRSRNEELASYLSLDPTTGVIRTISDRSEGPKSFFDRERLNFHYLTVEARDDNGRGNRNTVELSIYVTDVNDNPPVFEAKEYEAYLPEVKKIVEICRLPITIYS